MAGGRGHPAASRRRPTVKDGGPPPQHIPHHTYTMVTHFSLTLRSSFTHTHKFLGFRHSTPGILPTPSPYPHSYLSHTHRFLGSHDSNPDILPAFLARLTTLLRVSVRRVSCTPTPSPCPRSSFTHTQVPRFSQPKHRQSVCMLGETVVYPMCTCRQK
jgi:hypothetical protein